MYFIMFTKTKTNVLARTGNKSWVSRTDLCFFSLAIGNVASWCSVVPTVAEASLEN